MKEVLQLKIFCDRNLKNCDNSKTFFFFLQNTKTKNLTKLINSNCDNLKTQIVTKLKKNYCDKTQKL